MAWAFMGWSLLRRGAGEAPALSCSVMESWNGLRALGRDAKGCTDIRDALAQVPPAVPGASTLGTQGKQSGCCREPSSSLCLLLTSLTRSLGKDQLPVFSLPNPPCSRIGGVWQCIPSKQQPPKQRQHTEGCQEHGWRGDMMDQHL